MPSQDELPSVVLICHEDDAIDSQGLASWLAVRFRLQGIVLLRDKPGSTLRKLRRERRRVGLLRLLDVLLFRLVYRLFYARRDAAWRSDALQRIISRYPADLRAVRKLRTTNPNNDSVARFIAECAPELVIARCKFILKPEIFKLPRFGTFVLHPGICPQYRNAHGCFWALVSRDLDNVGMSLLKVDEGVDTGPIYLQASYPYDERRESHIVIQYRVVLENLEAITRVLHSVCAGQARPLERGTSPSKNWGQPWLTAFLQWRLARQGIST